MARHPRFVLPGHPQHVIQRGNNREVIFVSKQDYRFYLEKLHLACIKYQCEVHAYVLMTNHVHMMMTSHTSTGMSQVMQSLGRQYVQYFNYTYRRTGTLWEGRYKATVINADQYLLTCYRYIELNPVRAAMVAHPGDYPWSSYLFNATGKPNELLSHHSLYQALGKTAAERQSAYRALFKRHIDEQTLKAIRDSTNKAWALGNDRFRSRIEELTKRQVAPRPRGGDRKSEQFQRRSGINRV